MLLTITRGNPDGGLGVAVFAGRLHAAWNSNADLLLRVLLTERSLTVRCEVL
jgi:hypothetical protein